MAAAPRKWAPPLAVAAALVLMGAGVHRLFALRFEAGDILPPYSSFRADPLGTRALFETLAGQPGWRAERIVTPLDESRLAGPGTLFVIAFDPAGFDLIAPQTFDRLSGFARAGGRVVVALPPIQRRDSEAEARAKERSDRERARRAGAGTGTNAAGRAARPHPARNPADDGETRGEAAPAPDLVSLTRRWGVGIAYSTQAVDGVETGGAAGAAGPAAGAIPWRSSAYFTNSAPEWRTAWTRDGRAVVVERPWLGGTVVLVSDSYALSNEAMLRHRHADFLAWLAGPGPTAWFDEYHLGIEEQPGVLTFARRFRLGPVLAALLGLAGLFVWRNASSLLPPSDEAGGDARPHPDGFESRDGFVNLLRRHVPSASMAAVCLREWKRTVPPGDARLARRVAAMEAALRAAGGGARDPVSTYRKLQAVLTEKETP